MKIEASIASHADVRQAVASVHDFGSGDMRIVAYVVLRDGAAATPDSLRQQAAERLPRYMVPGHVVVLERIPLTPNGKVDRKALPLPAADGATARPYVQAHTSVQRTLEAIWKDLLRAPRVSIDDSFFDLGGHSMLVARMLGRIRDAFGVDLPMRTLFQAQTIQSLALRIEAVGLGAGPLASDSGRAEAREELEF